MKHVLHETGDADNPAVILDSNGEVVLGLCRVCGGGEGQLATSCIGRRLTEAEMKMIYDGILDVQNKKWVFLKAIVAQPERRSPPLKKTGVVTRIEIWKNHAGAYSATWYNNGAGTATHRFQWAGHQDYLTLIAALTDLKNEEDHAVDRRLREVFESKTETEN